MAGATSLNASLVAATELVKWLAIVAVVYLSVWQYAEIVGYSSMFPFEVTIAEFYLIVTGIIAVASLAIYLPWRVLAIRLRHKYNIMKDERWRPAIAVYILICAVPCFTLILVGYKSEPNYTNMTPTSITVLQMVVMGLVITEWMVKIQQEQFSFELISAMALDFFFAYDVIAFVMVAMADQNVYESVWVYPSTVFAVVAMLKYIPTQPLTLAERKASIGHVICILTSMFCNDLPFVVIRLSTMITFGFLIHEMIFALKNVFLILFNLIQLGVIFHNLRRPRAAAKAAAAKTAAAAVAGVAADADIVPSTAAAAVAVVAPSPEAKHADDGEVADEVVRRTPAERAAAVSRGSSRLATVVDGIIQQRRAFRHQDVWTDSTFLESMKNRIAAVERQGSRSDDGSESSSRQRRPATMTVEDCDSFDNEAFTQEHYTL